MAPRFQIALELEDEDDGAPVRLALCPARLTLTLRRAAGGPAPQPCVAVGDSVAAGDCLAESPKAAVHAPCAGTVAAVAGQIRLDCDPGAPWREPVQAGLADAATGDFGAFLARAGVVGMGGGKFPASVKFASAVGVHTLVVNGVECEPGTTIDAELLSHASDLVRAGAEALARAAGASTIVLAVGPSDKAVRAASLYPWKTLRMPGGYPGGAERLIVWRLTGRRLPAGALPARVGVLVQNVATVRAIGRAVRDGVPCVERPLSVLHPVLRKRRNLVVPVGIAAADVFAACGWPLAEGSTVVAGGLMMGQRLDSATAPVTRGTTSLTLLPAATPVPRSRACIRCGACHDACPLELHPIDIAERVDGTARPLPTTVRAQLEECFLCGVCSAVCPARIPIAARLREARHV